MKPLLHGAEAYALEANCCDLLQQAADWRLISVLLSAPRGDWRREVAALGGECQDSVLQEAAVSAVAEADEGLYDSTFGPGGPAPPREVSYRPASLSSQYLAELSEHYRAFGYVAPYQEPADHVAVESDFVAYLLLKQAFAQCRGDEAQAATVREAVARLISDHLAYIAAPLAERLADSDVRYFTLSAQALLTRTGPRPSSAEAKLPILEESCDDDLTCCPLEPFNQR